MHLSSLALMEKLLNEYAPDGQGRLAYDVGSFDVNGNYRKLVLARNWRYCGLDISSGPNVDKTVHPTDLWYPGDVQEQVELVISGQCLEHTKRPWEWIWQVSSLMLKDALLLLIAPAMWPEHKYPVDCWRILPDGMEALADYAELECLTTGIAKANPGDRHQDCWAVMRRNK